MAQSDFEKLARLQELGLSIDDVASAGIATVEDLSRAKATVAVNAFRRFFEHAHALGAGDLFPQGINCTDDFFVKNGPRLEYKVLSAYLLHYATYLLHYTTTSQGRLSEHASLASMKSTLTALVGFVKKAADELLDRSLGASLRAYIQNDLRVSVPVKDIVRTLT